MQRLERSGPQITPDSALVTYTVEVTNDQGTTFEALATTVYARENDTWLSVFHQQTLL